MYCKARNCRFPRSHITSGHKCGGCNKYGHGRMECRDGRKKAQLREMSRYDRLPTSIQCGVVGCRRSETHTTTGHYCRNCGWFFDTCRTEGCGGCYLSEDINQARQTLEESRDSDVQPIEIKCPVCRKTNSISDVEDCKIYGLEQTCAVCMEIPISIRLPDCKHACLCEKCMDRIRSPEEKTETERFESVIDDFRYLFTGLDNVYVIVYAGQGCNLYVRKKNGVFDAFFLHGDEQGQYGPDRTPSLNRFLSGLTQIAEDMALFIP